MKKATHKKETTPVMLGAKRICPQCGTKIYDFGKPTVICPRCDNEFDVEDSLTAPAIPREAKKASRPTNGESKADGASHSAEIGPADLAVDGPEPILGSVDDLDSDDDDVKDDIDVSDSEDEDES